jgi:hypothetical protein
MRHEYKNSKLAVGKEDEQGSIEKSTSAANSFER